MGGGTPQSGRGDPTEGTFPQFERGGYITPKFFFKKGAKQPKNLLKNPENGDPAPKGFIPQRGPNLLYPGGPQILN